MSGDSIPVWTITDDVDSNDMEIFSESEYSSGNLTASQNSNYSILSDDEIAGPSSEPSSKKIKTKENQQVVESFPFIRSVKSIKTIKVFPGIKPKVDPVIKSEVNIEFWKKSDRKVYALPKAGTSKSDAKNNLTASKTYPVFQMEEFAPLCHRYFIETFTPSNKTFLAAISKEHKLLENDLPPGIFVKTFENRLDLISALIEGPIDTPYEGCLFMFDIQLHKEHPKKPPKVHYWSFCENKLNPNLYTNGMVCLSLLGTWIGKSKTEQWTENSTIYQLLISIQSLILVPEPFFNEPGFEGVPHCYSLSATYNSDTLLWVLQSMTNHIEQPPAMFRKQILDYYRATGIATHQKLCSYLKCVPPFPLYLWSDLSMYKRALESFESAVKKLKSKS
ncbi:(E3-independent) E2 ubiquitin-conjugating enzyme UBE2O-like [Culicoides brevitarsis]|uniref:(E3-independent) E2 ubiquitin-conjugating enzyme UBE2O-like n=1 Tax=Culicoides brevitarsis TaxID=469753 RepID=UPI00307BDDFE